MNEAFVASLVELGHQLSSEGYDFVTVTPLTQQRVLRNRSGQAAHTLRDAFGWSMPFGDGLLAPNLLSALCSSGAVRKQGNGTFKSTIRFSKLGEHLYAHSAYPTAQEDAVFFGPDTYRFAALIETQAASLSSSDEVRILDMGCGGGPGGIVAAEALKGRVQELVLADINPIALAFSKANASLARMPDCTFVQSDLFQGVEGDFNLIVSNPPYLVDSEKRTYRHGGGEFGERLSQRIIEQSIGRLRPGGRLVLYTGSAIVEGDDPFSEWASQTADRTGCLFSRREIDPDVFGEELDRPEYAAVDRIAAIGLVLERPKA